MEPLSVNTGISWKQFYLSCATHPSHFSFGTKPPALPFTSSIDCLLLFYKIALLTLSSTITSPPIPSYNALAAPAIHAFAHMPLPSSTLDPRNAYFSAIVRLTWDIGASLSQAANSTSVRMLFFEKINIHTNSLPLIFLPTYPPLPDFLGLLPPQSQLMTRHWLSLPLETSSILSHQLLTYLRHHRLHYHRPLPLRSLSGPPNRLLPPLMSTPLLPTTLRDSPPWTYSFDQPSLSFKL